MHIDSIFPVLESWHVQPKEMAIILVFLRRVMLLFLSWRLVWAAFGDDHDGRGKSGINGFPADFRWEGGISSSLGSVFLYFWFKRLHADSEPMFLAWGHQLFAWQEKSI